MNHHDAEISDVVVVLQDMEEQRVKEVIDQIKTAILATLKQLNPGAATYYDAQAAALDQSFATYRALIAQIGGQFGGTPVAASRSSLIWPIQPACG